MAVLGDVDRPELLYRPFAPSVPKALKGGSLFSAIAKSDILLHHPFQSFSPIEDLLREAARDPDVLAIKQTLYRTGSDSPIVSALVDAASQGKEVTVVIELRARFDEADNLQLASRLQEAGAIVIYGIMAYKTHARCCISCAEKKVSCATTRTWHRQLSLQNCQALHRLQPADRQHSPMRGCA